MIGIVSIPRSNDAGQFTSFQHLYSSVGLNTGNLLFVNAVWDLIDGNKCKLEYSFDPQEVNEKCSKIIIPAANWLCTEKKFDTFCGQLAERIYKLKIPVIIIGLGAQSSEFDKTFARSLGDGCVSLVKLISQRSELISVRGWFTQSVLYELGITNVCVTGCPSLSNILASKRNLKIKDLVMDRVLLYPTRYYLDDEFLNSSGLDNQIFKFSFLQKTGLLYQSEAEEIAFLSSFSEFINEREHKFLKLYGCDSIEDLKFFINNNGNVFFDLRKWVLALSEFDFGFGTRLHGTISMLNSGIPAVLAWHDSRTREAAEFALIPSVPAKEFELTRRSIENLYKRVNIESYFLRRNEIKNIFNSFLISNGLKPKLVKKYIFESEDDE